MADSGTRPGTKTGTKSCDHQTKQTHIQTGKGFAPIPDENQTISIPGPHLVMRNSLLRAYIHYQTRMRKRGHKPRSSFPRSRQKHRRKPVIETHPRQALYPTTKNNTDALCQAAHEACDPTTTQTRPHRNKKQTESCSDRRQAERPRRPIRHRTKCEWSELGNTAATDSS